MCNGVLLFVLLAAGAFCMAPAVAVTWGAYAGACTLGAGVGLLACAGLLHKAVRHA